MRSLCDECQRFRFYGRLSNFLTYKRDRAYQVSHQMFLTVLIPRDHRLKSVSSQSRFTAAEIIVCYLYIEVHSFSRNSDVCEIRGLQSQVATKLASSIFPFNHRYACVTKFLRQTAIAQLRNTELPNNHRSNHSSSPASCIQQPKLPQHRSLVPANSALRSTTEPAERLR